MGMKDGWQAFVDLTKSKAISHMKTARFWQTIHTTFSLSLIFIGAATTILALVKGVPPLVLACVGGLATLVSTISAFLKPAERKAKQESSSKEFRALMLRMVMCETTKDYEELWKEYNKTIVNEPMVPAKYLSGLTIDWAMTPQFMILVHEQDKEFAAAMDDSRDSEGSQNSADNGVNRGEVEAEDKFLLENKV